MTKSFEYTTSAIIEDAARHHHISFNHSMSMDEYISMGNDSISHYLTVAMAADNAAAGCAKSLSTTSSYLHPNYSRQSSSQFCDSGISSADHSMLGQQVISDEEDDSHLPTDPIPQARVPVAPRKSCSIDIEDSLEGFEGILDKCYHLLVNLSYSSTTCQSSTKCFVHAANQSDSRIKSANIDNHQTEEHNEDPTDRLLQVALGFYLLRQRLMTCAYFKLSGNLVEELRQMADPVVDPSVEYFGLEWSSVFTRMKRLARLISSLKRDLVNGDVNMSAMKKSLYLIDQLSAELDLHAVAYKHGRLSNSYHNVATTPNHRYTQSMNDSDSSNSRRKGPMACSKARLVKQRHLSEADLNNDEVIQSFNSVQKKKLKKSILGKFSLHTLMGVISKM